MPLQIQFIKFQNRKSNYPCTLNWECFCYSFSWTYATFSGNCVNILARNSGKRAKIKKLSAKQHLVNKKTRKIQNRSAKFSKINSEPSPKQTVKRLVYFPTIFPSAIKITLNAIAKTLKNRKIRIIKFCVYVIWSFLGRILSCFDQTEPLGSRFRKLGYTKLRKLKKSDQWHQKVLL